MKLSEKLWRYLYRTTRRKIKNMHLDKYHVDICCPGCKEWFSLSGVNHKHTHEREPNSDLSICICGQCGTKSYWSPHIAPFPVRVDKNGIPFKEDV